MKIKIESLLFLAVFSFPISTFCRGHSQVEFTPGTDVFLYQVVNSKHGKQLKLVANISKVEGYDNQPSFSPDNQSLLYVSARDGKQTDIYQYNIKTATTRRLTHTPESEYSPMMESGNKTFTAVREGGHPYQSVHRYPYSLNKAEETDSSWAVKSHTPIGYYAFNKEQTAVAWSRWANAIYIFEAESPTAIFVTGHALPSKPQLIPNSELFSFVHRQGNDEQWIKSLNPDTRSITPLVKVFGNNIDYAWTPNNQVITARDSQLFIWKNGESSWVEWQDLEKDDVYQISRLAVSSDFRYVALVGKVPKQK